MKRLECPWCGAPYPGHFGGCVGDPRRAARYIVLALALVACVEPEPTPPDAPIDDTSPCCAYADDSDARACFLAEPGTPPSGTCGAFVCPSDGGIRRVNFCVP